MDGQVWLRGAQICHPLGLSDIRVLQRIVEKNIGEFGADETQMITMPTAGGEQQMRVFSLRGARLLALLARTPEAKAFRRWVLDLLEGRVRAGARHPVAALPTEAQLMLSDLAGMVPAGSPVAQAIAAYRDGRRGLPEVRPLTALRNERRLIAAEIAGSQKKMRGLYLRARRLGYSPETLKWTPPAQPALEFDGGDTTNV
jgi:hypothetical protein